MSCEERHNEVLREPSAQPVQLEGLQDEYRREFARRFRKLRGVLRTSIVDNDALRIKGGSRVNDEDDIEPRDDFEFDRDYGKQVEFREQLKQWLATGVLEEASQEQIQDGQHYTAIYLDTAYAQGLDFASQLLIDNGQSAEMPDDVQSVMSRPIHIRELETVYARNYEGLEDITEDIDRSLSNILTNALRQGWGTRQTADAINNEVEDIQHSRARTLARTEMLNTHNKASIQRYKEFEVEEVEILTHTPCPEICAPIEAQGPFPIDDIPQTGPPFHPNCVCVVVPA